MGCVEPRKNKIMIVAILFLIAYGAIITAALHSTAKENQRIIAERDDYVEHASKLRGELNELNKQFDELRNKEHAMQLAYDKLVRKQDVQKLMYQEMTEGVSTEVVRSLQGVLFQDGKRVNNAPFNRWSRTQRRELAQCLIDYCNEWRKTGTKPLGGIVGAAKKAGSRAHDMKKFLIGNGVITATEYETLKRSPVIPMSLRSFIS